MEADFRRFYHLDLSEALYGNPELSGRTLINLWRHLPPDCAIAREFDPRGALQGRWTTTDHLLAFLSEQMDVLSSMFYSANAGKNAKKWKPISHTRPDLPFEYQQKPKQKRSANATEIRAILKGEL